MEEALRAILTGSSALTALVPAGRINWGAHPQGVAQPYITMMVVSDTENMTMDGPDGLSQGRVQVDCYAPTYAMVKQVSRAVRAVLDGYRGGGFQLVEHDATRDSREGGSNEAERLFRVGLDFSTHWRQP
jgi:hypothetical protein